MAHSIPCILTTRGNRYWKSWPTDVIARQLDRSSRDDVWCRSPYLPRSGPQTSSVFNRCCHSWGRCEDIINKSPQSRRHCHFPRLNRVSGDQWEDADNRRMGQGLFSLSLWNPQTTPISPLFPRISKHSERDQDHCRRIPPLRAPMEIVALFAPYPSRSNQRGLSQTYWPK